MRRQRFWKLALLVVVPLVIFLVMRERNSWRPRTLYLDAGTKAFQVTYSQDGQRLAVAGRDVTSRRLDKILCWDATGRSLLWDFSTSNGLLNSIAFVPDSHDIASLYRDANGEPDETEIRFNAGGDGKLQRTLRAGNLEGASGLCCWRDKTTFTTSNSQSLKLTDLNSGRTSRIHFKSDTVKNDNVYTLLLAPDGKTLVGGQYAVHDTLSLLDLPSGKVRHLPQSSDGDGWSALAFSNDSDLLACSSEPAAPSKPYRVKLWDIHTAKVRYIEFHIRTKAKALAFSMDNQMLAIGDLSGQISLWDTATGVRLRTLQHGNGEIVTVAFSPDGRTLVSCCDGIVKLWRIK